MEGLFSWQIVIRVELHFHGSHLFINDSSRRCTTSLTNSSRVFLVTFKKERMNKTEQNKKLKAKQKQVYIRNLYSILSLGVVSQAQLPTVGK